MDDKKIIEKEFSGMIIKKITPLAINRFDGIRMYLVTFKAEKIDSYEREVGVFDGHAIIAPT